MGMGVFARMDFLPDCHCRFFRYSDCRKNKKRIVDSISAYFKTSEHFKGFSGHRGAIPGGIFYARKKLSSNGSSAIIKTVG